MTDNVVPLNAQTRAAMLAATVVAGMHRSAVQHIIDAVPHKFLPEGSLGGYAKIEFGPEGVAFESKSLGFDSEEGAGKASELDVILLLGCFLISTVENQLLKIQAAHVEKRINEMVSMGMLQLTDAPSPELIAMLQNMLVDEVGGATPPQQNAPSTETPQ